MREKVQQNALDAFIKNDCKGILKIKTGIGKTRIAAMIIHKMIELGLLSPLDTVSVYAEVSMDIKSKRRQDFMKEWNLVSNYNINFEFYTYQSLTVPKGKMIILDEIDYIGEVMSKPFMNYKGYVLGLTATINQSATEGQLSKAQLLAKIAPVVYEYGFNEALRDNNTNKVNLYILRHKLDNVNKTVQITKNWWGTEQEYWNYWKNKADELMVDNPDWALSIKIHKLPKFLYSLPSKIKVAKTFLSKANNPTLGFAAEINFLKSISMYTLEDHTFNTYIDMFTKGQINHLLSSKKLQRGFNLPEVRNIFLIGMGKNSDIIEQVIGRSRLNKDRITNVIMIVTENTYEERWFQEITKKRKGGKIIKELEYNFVGFI